VSPVLPTKGIPHLSHRLFRNFHQAILQKIKILFWTRLLGPAPTIRAAERLGRRAVGIDNNAAYCAHFNENQHTTSDHLREVMWIDKIGWENIMKMG